MNSPTEKYPEDSFQSEVTLLRKERGDVQEDFLNSNHYSLHIFSG